MSGLAGGDAVLNVQAGGEVFFSESVGVQGIDQSGQVMDLSGGSEVNVTVPIPETAQGEIATLYFDLVGFGDDASSAQVSNIVLNSERGWQNPVDRFDVSDDREVSANDALIIINELSRKNVFDPVTTRLVSITDSVGPPPYYDVNGDGNLTALDALQVINQLSRPTVDSERTWQNVLNQHDVDDSGDVTAADALQVINELAAARVHDIATRELVEITDTVGPAPYYDVNGDNLLTATDALLIINQLARRGAEPEDVSKVDDALGELFGEED